jgi:4-amino-4-deoxy-L-arabinose transferase-like glycosyltransferase
MLTNGLLQLLILSYYYSTASIMKVMMGAVAVLCILSSIALGILNLLSDKSIEQNDIKLQVKKALMIASLIGLVISPAIWSATTLIYPESGTFPSAGLGLAAGNGMGNAMNAGNMGNTDNNSTTEKLIKYLQANKTNEKYLVAVQSANSYASEIIIKTGESVMTLGGFSGSDNILTLEQFKKLVSEGQIRYAITGGGGGAGGSSEITSWIQKNGKSISESEWNGTSSTTTTSGSSNSSTNSQKQRDGGFGGGAVQLYDLKVAISSNS